MRESRPPRLATECNCVDIELNFVFSLGRPHRNARVSVVSGAAP